MRNLGKSTLGRRNHRYEFGSVLLETVIVIPLFMLLIGGIMWVGQLIYDKQKLVIADRYVAWNLGNRYGSGNAADNVQQKFFPDATHDQVVVLSPVLGTVNRWWWEGYAGVNLNVTIPPWTLGWFAADAAINGRATPASPVALQGRDVVSPSGSYEGHVVIMRSDWTGSTRYGSANVNQNLGIRYGSVFSGEDWAPPVPSASP